MNNEYEEGAPVGKNWEEELRRQRVNPGSFDKMNTIVSVDSVL